MAEKKRFRPTLGQYRDALAKINELQEQVDSLKEDYNKALAQKDALLHRGLWERIVNKQV